MIPWIFISILLLFCVILLLSRQLHFIKQMDAFRSLVDGIVQGNFNLRFRPHFRDKTMQALGASFNTMMDQVQDTFDRALRLEEERKQMISNLSHDLRTPLTSLLGYVEALLEDESLTPEEKKQYLQIISGKGTLLSLFIQQFFELARIEADNQPLKPEKINITEKIQEILFSYYHDIQKANLTPLLHFPEKSLYILGEEESLERVLQNLIANVLRYGKGGQVLGISLGEKDDLVHIEIWDKGQGIAAKDLPHVFTRFYTGENSRNLTSSGTGLGLAIVKILVEKMHGTIQVKSIPYERTSFLLTLRKVRNQNI